MRYYPRKVDANQAKIVAALRAAGCSVQLLHAVGQGCPDLLVGVQGENWLLEVKAPRAQVDYGATVKGDHAVTAARQSEWARRWRGAPPLIVRTPHEALEVVGKVRSEPL